MRSNDDDFVRTCVKHVFNVFLLQMEDHAHIAKNCGALNNDVALAGSPQTHLLVMTEQFSGLPGGST